MEKKKNNVYFPLENKELCDKIVSYYLTTRYEGKSLSGDSRQDGE